MLSVNSGTVPVIWILGALIESLVDPIVEAVCVRFKVVVGWDVHQIPKFAIERYIYLAGLVNDSVGVTLY